MEKNDDVGNVLVKVQDDLKELKRSLVRLSLEDRAEVWDIRPLNAAISRTEDGIRRHAEDYLKAFNNTFLTLPCIEEPDKKTTPAKLVRWQAPLGTLPNSNRQRSQNPRLVEKKKTSLNLDLFNNLFNPKNNEQLEQNYGVLLPHLHTKAWTSVKIKKVFSFSVSHGDLPRRLKLKPLPECQNTTEGLQASAFDLSSVQSSVQPRAVHGLQREDTGQTKMGHSISTMSLHTSGLHLKLEDIFRSSAIECSRNRSAPTPPPSAASASSSDSRALNRGIARHSPLSSQIIPVAPAVSKYPFRINNGQIDSEAPDYVRFKKQYCLCWAGVLKPLERLQKMLQEFEVPLAQVCGEKLAAGVQSGELDWRGAWGRIAHVEKLLSLLENRDEVWDLMCQPGQRYKGCGGHQAAAVLIQSCWRRYSARNAYLVQLRSKRAAEKIARSLVQHIKWKHLQKSLEASRLRQLEKFRFKAESLAANWKHITSTKRTIIHVPSLGYSLHQRLRMGGFDVLQNYQMGRLCEIRDENVEVIYVSPVRLGEDVLQYYHRLLGLQTAIELGDASAADSHCSRRFTILIPDALETFSNRNMCLASLLKYSPRTLQRIKNLIKGKQAYMVSGVTHIDDLAVAEELDVPLLGTEPDLSQLYNTKSGGRRIFRSAEVNMPPGMRDIYTLEQLHKGLAELITKHTEIQRWLFKIDSDVSGQGMACFDVFHLNCHPWAQQELGHVRPEQRASKTQEFVMSKILEEVSCCLASHSQTINTFCYPTWTSFLEHFLQEGGVIEAFPPSKHVKYVSVDILLEPVGEVRLLSSADQLPGCRGLKSVVSSVPQSSICPDVLLSICTRVGKACQQRSIMGHISLGLIGFMDSNSLEQQVWAVDLELGYSKQLSMTQLMLMMTRGTLHCQTANLNVPPPVRDIKSSVQGINRADTRRFAVMCTQLLHTNLSLVYYSTFFLMCKAQGIGYDVKARQGTVLALHDSNYRRTFGMLTISENLQGALLTFARNLSVIHQEISAANMQGTTNFMELTKDIEEVLGITVQNQTASQERKEDSGAGRKLFTDKSHS